MVAGNCLTKPGCHPAFSCQAPVAQFEQSFHQKPAGEIRPRGVQLSRQLRQQAHLLRTQTSRKNRSPFNQVRIGCPLIKNTTGKHSHVTLRRC